MPVRNINFRSQTPRAYNPTGMTLGAGKQLSSAFDDLATLGNSMNQKRIEGEMTSVIGKYAGQDITNKATQELMMGEMAGVQGATIKDVKAASDMLFGRLDANREYDLNEDKFDETKRHNRAGEYKMFEGPNGGQYGIDTGNANRDYLVGIESGGSSTAQNPNSSAYGLFQQTDQIRNTAIKRGWVSDMNEARSEAGQKRINHNMEKENKMFLDDWGVPLNRDTNLTMHQLGANDSKSFFDRSATPEQLSLWKTNAPIQYKAYMNGGYNSKGPKVDTLIEGRKPVDVGSGQMLTDKSGKPALKQFIDKDANGVETTVYRPVDMMGNRLDMNSTTGKISRSGGSERIPKDTAAQEKESSLFDQTASVFKTVKDTYRDDFVGSFDSRAEGTKQNLGFGNEDYAVFEGSMKNMTNVIRHQLFGSALTATETAEWEKQLPSVRANETEFVPKWNAFLDFSKVKMEKVQKRLDRQKKFDKADEVEAMIKDMDSYKLELNTDERSMFSGGGRENIREDIVEDPGGTAAGIVRGSPLGLAHDMTSAMVGKNDQGEWMVPELPKGNPTGEIIGASATGGLFGKKVDVGGAVKDASLKAAGRADDYVKRTVKNTSFLDKNGKIPLNATRREAKRKALVNGQFGQEVGAGAAEAATGLLAKLGLHNTSAAVNGLVEKIMYPVSQKARDNTALKLVAEIMETRTKSGRNHTYSQAMMVVDKILKEKAGNINNLTGTATGALLGASADDN